MILQLRTKDDLETLKRNKKSPAWRIAESRLKEIYEVEIYQFDGKRVLKADFNYLDSERNDEGKLIVAFEDAVIENCDFKWVGQNSVKYAKDRDEEEDSSTDEGLNFSEMSDYDFEDLLMAEIENKDRDQGDANLQALFTSLCDFIGSGNKEFSYLLTYFIRFLNKHDRCLSDDTCKFDFDPDDDLTFHFNPDPKDDAGTWPSASDYEWTDPKSGKTGSFMELLFERMELSFDDVKADNFNWEDMERYTKTIFIYSLRHFMSEYDYEVVLALLIWTVLDDPVRKQEGMQDMTLHYDSGLSVLRDILGYDIDEKYNSDENPERERYGDFIIDIKEMAMDMIDEEVYMDIK